MNASSLKLQFFAYFILLFSMAVLAQNPRFIYIQAENKQPFYVKIDNKTLSSSESGYIIIPGLTQNSYRLIIGSPKNEWVEFNVTVDIENSDVGLLLKKTENKTWGIVNLQTNQSLASSKEQVEIVTQGDEFARILAQVVNDPSIAEVTVIKKAEEQDTITRDAKTVTTSNVKEGAKAVEIKPANKDVSMDKTEIAKLKQEKTGEGLLVTYLDMKNTAVDTVKIFMPVIKKETTIEKQAEVLQTAIKKDEAAKNESRFLNMELQNPNAIKDTASALKDDFVITEKKAAVKPKTETTLSDTGRQMINSDCKKAATQNDFLELRKKMAAETGEKEMLKTANKQFINTCFTTEQVKNLGVLFISEEERYKFFVAAFPFVSDTHNFGTLEDQLSGEYYKGRFKAMVGR
jgi:hypothetical protein